MANSTFLRCRTAGAAACPSPFRILMAASWVLFMASPAAGRPALRASSHKTILAASGSTDHLGGYGAVNTRLMRVNSTLASTLVRAAEGFSTSEIPKLIHSTWKSWGQLSKLQHKDADRWIHMNPGYTYIFWDDAAVNDFLKEHAPAEDWDMLRNFKVIQRMDYFRYLLLYKIGGIYNDIDVAPVRPLGSWFALSNVSQFQGPRLITGWEVRTTQKASIRRGFARPNQMQQWTIVSSPRHPVLLDVLQGIRKKYGDHVLTTLDLTGPGVWSDVLLAHVGTVLPPYIPHSDGRGPLNQVSSPSEGIWVFQKDAFACGMAGCLQEARLVRHRYQGSWKPWHKKKTKKVTWKSWLHARQKENKAGQSDEHTEEHVGEVVAESALLEDVGQHNWA